MQTLLITIPFDAFPDSYARLQAAYPDMEILHYNTADPAATVPAAVWARTTVHLTHALFARSRAQAPRLRWVHVYSGGINQLVTAAGPATPLFADPTVRWTRNSGVHAPQIGEWVAGAVLAHVRGFVDAHRWQAAQAWTAGAAAYRPRGELRGRTVAFLGYGAIARHAARILAACGMRVVAYTRRPRTTAAARRNSTTAYTPPGTGDAEGLLPQAWYHGDLDAFLAAVGPVDVVVVALPSTPATRHALGAAQLARLRGAFLVNVARGDLVVTDALVAALHDGTLAGAALDVTDPEPLPPGHALWTAPNTTVTPHISGVSAAYMPRTVDILLENLERLEGGEPLLNVIEREEGY